MRERLAKLLAAATGVLIAIGALVFGALQQRSMQSLAESVDPAEWATLYPRHYASFQRTAESYGRTEYGGSEPYDKLAAKPFRRRAFAGHPFALEYRAARGHHYAELDQRESRRTQEVDQPAACIHCHAAEAPGLIALHGESQFYRLRYADVRDDVQFGTSCTDCHAPATMELAVTRPAFIAALARTGVDVTAASRDELRTYVCAQCHLEYYTGAEDGALRMPWDHGRRVEDIERYYDDAGFADFEHAETGAALIKIQHPEFELHSAGLHASIGVTCVDCHMPRVEEQGTPITDHWIRSPLTQLDTACSRCHRGSPAALRERVVAIQRRTVARAAAAETAIIELIDAMFAARAAGASGAEFEDARSAHRHAQLRWDFVDAENSAGFHASREAARLLDAAIEIARAGRLAAERAAAEARAR